MVVLNKKQTKLFLEQVKQMENIPSYPIPTPKLKEAIEKIKELSK